MHNFYAGQAYNHLAFYQDRVAGNRISEQGKLSSTHPIGFSFATNLKSQLNKTRANVHQVKRKFFTGGVASVINCIFRYDDMAANLNFLTHNIPFSVIVISFFLTTDGQECTNANESLVATPSRLIQVSSAGLNTIRYLQENNLYKLALRYVFEVEISSVVFVPLC